MATYYQLIVKSRHSTGVEMRNTHYYVSPDGQIPNSNIQDAVDDLLSKYQTRLAARLVPAVSYYAVDVRQVDSPGLPSAEFTPTAGSWVGTNATATMPLQLCALVNWKSPTVKPRLSRVFISGFGEDTNIEPGVITPGLQGNLESLAADLETLTIAAQADFEKVAAQWNVAGTYVTDANSVTAAPISTTWYSQRRRRPGVGI